MQPEARKYLYDIQQAADLIVRFTSGQDLDRYLADEMLRSAVERQFEVIGEALNQLARRDAALADRISDYRRVIAFRNILIHGYAEVDHRLVWDLVRMKLPILRGEIRALLESR